MSISLMFDDIIMNMIRNKALEYHKEGVDSFLQILRTKEFICTGGQLKNFNGIKALMKFLMLHVYISILKGSK